MYKQELINRMIRCSPMLQLTLSETTGVGDFSDIPESHLDVIYGDCVNILEGDISSLGLIVDYDGTSLHSMRNVDLLITLREVFDTHNLLSKRLNPKFDAIVEGVFENLLEASNLYVDLIEGLYPLFELSDKWGELHANMHRVQYDQEFSKHLLTILSMEMGPSAYDDTYTAVLAERLVAHQTRIDRVYQIVGIDYPELKLTTPEDRDGDLGRVPPIEFGAFLFDENVYFIPGNVSSSEELLRHVTQSRHHLEYWLHRKETPGPRDLCRMAIEYFAYDVKVQEVTSLLEKIYSSKEVEMFASMVNRFKGYDNE